MTPHLHHSRLRFAHRWIPVAALLAVTILIAGAAASMVSGSPQDGGSFEEAIEKAQLNFNHHEYDAALKYFKRANAIQGNNCAECLWGIAQTYSKLGVNESVIETCDRLARVAAADKLMSARAYTLKGMTYSNSAIENVDEPDLGKIAQAEVCFRKVLEIDPEFEFTRYNLGVTLIRLGREADGLRELHEFVRTGNDSDILEEARMTIANPRRARENYSPDFIVDTLEGKRVALSDLRGKVVLLDFWGTWCRPCLVSLPSLFNLSRRYAKEPFVIVSVSSDFDFERWRSFVQRRKMTWPQSLDEGGRVQRIFSVNAIPTYVVIDHEGIIRHRSTGFNEYVEEKIAGVVKKALTAAKTSPPAEADAAPRVTAVPSLPLAAPPAAPRKAGILPTPVLEVLPGEVVKSGRNRVFRFPLRIKNWAELPAELFEPATDAEPCENSGVATRLQVIVWKEFGNRLLEVCGATSAQAFEKFALTVNQSQLADRIYVTLRDRRTGASVRSNVVPLPIVAAR